MSTPRWLRERRRLLKAYERFPRRWIAPVAVPPSKEGELLGIWTTEPPVRISASGRRR